MLSYSPINILTDKIETEPTDEFEKLADIIAGIIEGSTPEFTIGVYGEWGTGKTTLMNAVRSRFSQNAIKPAQSLPEQQASFWPIQNPFKKSSKPKSATDEASVINERIPTIWFNAWRYERENARATIPLMVMIIRRLGDELQRRKRTTFANKLKDEFLSFLDGCEFHFGLTFLGIEAGAKYSRATAKSVKTDAIPIPTIQRGIDFIEKMIQELKAIPGNSDYRLVVFIDDLDRCSPKTALDVFESVKILLNIKGMVHVIGLSNITVAKLIKEEFKVHDISGDDYIQKIIQLPIWIPDWKVDNIKKLIEKNILSVLGDKSPYYDAIKNREKLLTIAIKSNPRDLKRFVNSFIVDFEFYQITNQKKKISDTLRYHKLITSLIKHRWHEIYDVLIQDDEKSKTLNDMIQQVSHKKSLDEYRKITDEWTENNEKLKSKEVP